MTTRDAASSHRPARARAAAWLRGLALALPVGLGLAACGGSDTVGGSNLSCSTPDQETWLADYFSSNYLWAATSPNDPPQTDSVSDYFQSLLYTGGDPNFPSGVTDVWSTFTTDDAFNMYYADGQALGYGVFVNGLEVQGTAGPLLVRYVDPGSPAAAAGIARGDEVTSLNGTPEATLIANNDYTVLNATAASQTLTVTTHNAGGDHSYTLSSATYALTPVQGVRVVTSPGGRAMGYVMVTDMIDQALASYDAAFAQFKTANVQDIVIDLRYAGAGTVDDGEIMASYPDGAKTTNQIYANLYFNEFIASYQNSYYTFDAYSNALALPRVFVLTGPRTCGPAEQLVNGLSPYVTVVTLGDATCGKPLGSTPVSNCGTTYSAITFQVTNASNVGSYYGGLAATCPVAENLGVAIGADGDPLLAGAEQYADSGTCPPSSLAAPLSAKRHAAISSLQASWLEPTTRRGLVSR